MGDLAPGQTKTIHGKIVLVPGGADAALERLRFD